VTDRPILFSGEMVRAILDGSKTMTRMIVKPQPKGHGDYWDLYNHGPEWALWLNDNRMSEPKTWPCPFGAPGDRLWVRETWAAWYGAHDDYGRVHYRADGATHETDGRGICPTPSCEVPPDGIVWHPSIHMPRWASRITLEVTSVRLERVRDITEADAIAEGFVSPGDFAATYAALYGQDTWHSNPYVWVIEFRRIQP
jgi:hypothetical protein